MKTEHEKLKAKLEKLEDQLAHLPRGNLMISRSKGYVRFFECCGHDKFYIKKGNQEAIRRFAYKKYISLQIQDISKEMKAIELYLESHPQEQLSEQFLIENPEIQQLLSKIFKPKKQELAEWMNAEYPKSTYKAEQLIHPTSAGFYVRSKSEVLIVSCLLKYKIPFRYECELLIGRNKYYPDFTIRHPKTGELFYWEHFGRMDDPEYRRKCYTKLQKYGNVGIIPTINLITTYETQDHPLGIIEIEKMIQEYFL